ncbi:MAG: hypothetical protein ACRDQX_10235 [Pseudonocardiaceae bacterium]
MTLNTRAAVDPRGEALALLADRAGHESFTARAHALAVLATETQLGRIADVLEQLLALAKEDMK